MIVELQKAFESKQFQNRQTETLIPIGVSFNFEYVFEDLKDLRSIIIAGATGSGKSTFNHCLITSLLKQNNNISLILYDAKRVELFPYNGIECLLGEVTTKTDDIKEQFEYLEKEFSIRSASKKEGVDIYKNYDPIIIVIEECSSIMCQQGEYFNQIIPKIAKEGPDLNMYIIISTARPAINVFTEEIKESFFAKIAFATASLDNSDTIIGETGAEKLLGEGDMLFKKGDEPIRRLQGFYVSDEEVKNVVNEDMAGQKGLNNEQDEIKNELEPIDSKIDISKERIKRTFDHFDIKVKMGKVNIGPMVTQFIIKPKNGVKLSKIMALENVLAMNLTARSVRIDVSFFEKGLISIEVSNYNLTK